MTCSDRVRGGGKVKVCSKGKGKLGKFELRLGTVREHSTYWQANSRVLSSRAGDWMGAEAIRVTLKQLLNV